MNTSTISGNSITSNSSSINNNNNSSMNSSSHHHHHTQHTHTNTNMPRYQQIWETILTYIRNITNRNGTLTTKRGNNKSHSTSNYNNYIYYYINYYKTKFYNTNNNNKNIQFIIATLLIFIFFGIHNYLQELIQYQFQLYNQQLNVMLGYYEVFGVFIFTYLERMILSYQYNNQNNKVSTSVSNASSDTTIDSSTSSGGDVTSPSTSANATSTTPTTSNTSSSSLSTSNNNSNSNNNNTDLMMRKAPLSVYPFLTLCLLSSSALSNMSLNYINFPTKVVFRSCKLIPTMIIASIMNPQKQFSLIEYSCAIIICIGLICFGAAEFHTKPVFHPIGIVFVSLSIFADALLPNAQESVFHTYNATRNEVTLYTNLFTFIIMTITTLLDGTLLQCILLMYQHTTIALYFLIYTIISYLAISCHMNIVQMYGGVAAVLVATGRKAMTLMISFILFPKIFTLYYPIGTILVLSGVTIASLDKVYNKTKTKSSKNSSSNSNNGKKTFRSFFNYSNTNNNIETMPLKSHMSDIINDDDNDIRDEDHYTNHHKPIQLV